ncbi:response regulator transcription factor [Paractinoplanes rishiriensis]|uniref:Helix-turn-helix transcriptional regulator n=1 Tax=Paractinoplanes rishiriensis TaxID=1050105 RepID=A0A919JWD6_9ACTN|nr:response regulator transcription factor [Actinoplanes rishiriensis]GIE94795.1 helix-turn-helix transcriptional regulator [Actinoplanes rishiriensis]
MIGQRPPTVWIDDSHAIVRRGMAACLQQADFVVRGESAVLNPEPVVADLDVLVFEYGGGATLRRAVRLSSGGGTRLVATVRDVTEQSVREMVDAGVCAILPHLTLTADSLITSLRAVVAGNVALPGDMLAKLLVHVTQTSHLGPQGLNPRERSVLRLLADGMDTRGIAEDLRFSERTVKNVVHDVLTKLNCRTRAQAVAVATREGVI